jgi:hypothetical protein
MNLIGRDGRTDGRDGRTDGRMHRQPCPFLQTWLDRTSPDCMFSPRQLRTWTSVHLRGVASYLKCGPQHVPALEKEQFNSLEAVSGVVLEDEALAGTSRKWEFYDYIYDYVCSCKGHIRLLL